MEFIYKLILSFLFHRVFLEDTLNLEMPRMGNSVQDLVSDNYFFPGKEERIVSGIMYDLLQYRKKLNGVVRDNGFLIL